MVEMHYSHLTGDFEESLPMRELRYVYHPCGHRSVNRFSSGSDPEAAFMARAVVTPCRTCRRNAYDFNTRTDGREISRLE
jgi:hypothetical protein